MAAAPHHSNRIAPVALALVLFAATTCASAQTFSGMRDLASHYDGSVSATSISSYYATDYLNATLDALFIAIRDAPVDGLAFVGARCGGRLKFSQEVGCRAAQALHEPNVRN